MKGRRGKEGKEESKAPSGNRTSLRQRFNISADDAAIKRDLEHALRLSIEEAQREEERRKEEEKKNRKRKGPVKNNTVPEKKAKAVRAVKKEEKKEEEKKEVKKEEEKADQKKEERKIVKEVKKKKEKRSEETIKKKKEEKEEKREEGKDEEQDREIDTEKDKVEVKMASRSTPPTAPTVSSSPPSTVSSSPSSTLSFIHIFLVIFLSTAALFVFQSGFLLKREQLSERSRCEDVSINSSSCWIPSQHSRAIIVLIDALRHDFLSSQSIDNLPYTGQMPFTASLVGKGGLLCKAEADPPTTTLQRLKALGTGGLPTFIDASDNFNSDAPVQEDNIFIQLNSTRRNATLLGDETWLSLYPHAFHRKFAMDSFDIQDLHKVDNHILDHLEEEVKRADSSLIIAHFLGVDHAGHKYGPLHIEMAAKLRQMDRVIKDVVSWMREDDLLIVLGDHGMTETGDHGGDSDDEVNAAFMAYSPSYSFPTPPDWTGHISQVDLVPTLSLLLDFPIPFSSLGSPIIPLFITESAAKNALKLTAMQVERYVYTYSRMTGDSRLEAMGDELPLSQTEQRELLSRLQKTLRAQWTSFSIPLMRIALLSLADTLASLMCPPCPSLVITRSAYLLLLLSILNSPTPYSVSISLLTLLLPISLSYSLFTSLLSLPPLSSLHSFSSLFPYLLLSLSFLIPFSNSLIVFEPAVLRFLTVTLVLYSFYRTQTAVVRSYPVHLRVFSLSRLSSVPSLLLLLFLLRIQPLFLRCREEDHECVQYPSPLPFPSLSLNSRLFRFILSVASLPLLHYKLHHSCKSSLDSISQSLSIPTLLLIILHFTSCILPDTVLSQYTSHYRIIAQSVYSLCFISFVCSMLSSCLYRNLSLFRSVLYTVVLILGEGLSPSLSCLLLLLMTLVDVVPPSLFPLSVSLLLPYSFYYLGHSPTLSSIPWHSAFVGLSSSSPRLLSALLVLTHLFSHSLLLPLFPSTIPPFEIVPQSLVLLTSSIARTLFSSISVTILRRHLMVWKIFAPHWIFDAISLLVLFVSVISNCLIHLTKSRS